MKKLVLVGGGGHAKVIIDALRGSKKFTVIGLVDIAMAKGDDLLGVKVLGSDDELPLLFKEGVRHAFIGVGSIGDCATRKKIDINLRRIGFEIPVIVHPKAIIASDAVLGDGTFVAAAAVINPGVRTGRNVIINTSSSVDHDCILGDFVHIAPGVTLSGGVKVGDDTHVGTGAKIIQCLNIGKRCMIGAGATVRHDMADNTKSYIQSAEAYEK
jgi:UDP-perosamine 4-acetyltransferase